MEEVSYKAKLIEGLIIDLNKYKEGFFLTLNTFGKDRIRLDESAQELCKRLNSFLYGRQYDRKEKRLKIVGAIENGSINEGLHIHLIVMHNNDTQRTLVKIESFIRENWYHLINANTRFAQKGNLVDVRSIYDIEGLTIYVSKSFNHYSYQDNPLYY